MNAYDNRPLTSLEGANWVSPSHAVPGLDLVLHGQQDSKPTGICGEMGSGMRGPEADRPLGGRSKRIVDVAIALVALAAAAPIMAALALLIKMTIGGPVIFSHTRIGFNGRKFACYKFRTMVRDSDRVLHSYLAANPEADDEWKRSRKLRRDPRVTRLGLLLRKSSLDELPQLVNILLGDMSCVGPRPIVAEELERYGVSAPLYLMTRPGLTGLWQVTSRNSTDYAYRVELDSGYVHHWSLRSDAAILAKTVFAVMRFDRTS